MPSTKTGRKTQARKPAAKVAADPRERLRRLVDELPEVKLVSVLHYAAYLRDLGGPFGDVEAVDEPLTPEEIAGAEQGWRDYLAGKARPWEEVRKELADA